jgi:hypothetical protein
MQARRLHQTLIALDSWTKIPGKPHSAFSPSSKSIPVPKGAPSFAAEGAQTTRRLAGSVQDAAPTGRIRVNPRQGLVSGPGCGRGCSAGATPREMLLTV